MAFPDLARPRRVTSFNILPGIVFLYFWRGINRPQLTVYEDEAAGLAAVYQLRDIGKYHDWLWVQILHGTLKFPL